MSQRLSDAQVAALRDTAMGAKYLRDLCEDLREARAALRKIANLTDRDLFGDAVRIARVELGD